MALVPIGNDTFIDTDDLEQAEYHYFRKAESLGYRTVAIAILKGRVTAEDIESDPYYSWLVTAEGGLTMKVNEACREFDLNCPYYTGVCRNQFGRFKCRSCARNKDTEVLTFASDGSSAWSTYRVLILTHALGPDGRDIRRYVDEWHHDATIDYLNYQNLLWGILNQKELDHVVENLKNDRYLSIYIDTQDKKERRAVRKHFRDKYGLDLHIQTYAKLVEMVKRDEYRKLGG